MPRAFLGLGANVGDRIENLRMALRMLGACGRVLEVSSLYRSDALVPEGEPPGPDFLNAVCAIDTDVEPVDLLRAIKRIEHDIGRRPAPRWAARPIDIDILLYDGVTLETPELTIPHPLLAERNFVLVPLAELAPEVVHPVLGRKIGELAEEVDFAGLEHVEGPEWAAAPGVGDPHDQDPAAR